jgi:hypothetical protein
MLQSSYSSVSESSSPSELSTTSSLTSSWDDPTAFQSSIKSEAVTNHLILELLDTLSQFANHQNSFTLEWAADHDDFDITLPRGGLVSKKANHIRILRVHFIFLVELVPML